MNKVFLISLAAVLAISVGLVGCTGAAGGGPYNHSVSNLGDAGIISNCITSPHSEPIAPVYIDVLNDAGGILVDGSYFEPELYMYCDSGDPDVSVANTYKAIDDIEDGDVGAIWSGGSSPLLAAQAPITNANGGVLMAFDAGASFFRTDPTKLPSWPYVFMHMSSSDWYQIPVLAKTLADEGATTAYICYENDDNGAEYMATAATSFTVEGITIVGNQSVLATDPSFDPDALITAMNATNPDVVCLFCHPEEVLAITTAAIDRAFNVGAWVVGLGGNYGWFAGPDGVGDAAEDIICFATANNKTSTDMEWLFNDVLEPELGFGGLDFWGSPLYWAAMQMWQNAIEAVGTVNANGFPEIDQDEFRDELASYNSYANGVDTVLGRTWYTMFGDGGGILAYECHTGEIGQWRNGYVEIVGYAGIATDLPNYAVTASFNYPKAAWPTP